MNGFSPAPLLRRATLAVNPVSPGCGATTMSQGSCSTLSMLARNTSAFDGRDVPLVYLNPSSDTGVRLSRYARSRQRLPSHDRHVHEVAPGVCPGVKCAVIASGPTRRVARSAIVSTFLIGSY